MRSSAPLALAAILALAGSSGALAQAAKPAPKAPAAKAAAPPRPAAGAFNARDPAGLIALLATMDAKATITRTTDDEVYLKIEAPSFAFAGQYVGCVKGANCQGLAFSATSSQRSSTLAQLNGFNQSSFTCRVFEDTAGQPHVMYSTLIFPSDTREDVRQHIGAWQGCLSTFGLFLADPIGYLADAP